MPRVTLISYLATQKNTDPLRALTLTETMGKVKLARLWPLRALLFAVLLTGTALPGVCFCLALFCAQLLCAQHHECLHRFRPQYGHVTSLSSDLRPGPQYLCLLGPVPDLPVPVDHILSVQLGIVVSLQSRNYWGWRR